MLVSRGVVVLLVALTSVAAQAPRVEDALARRILAPDQTRVDTQAWAASRVPVLDVPATREAWETQAATLRTRILDEVVYRGAAATWRTQSLAVEDMGHIDANGYRVRKIRFQAVPGLHVPALIYEPLPAPTRPTPVVLNFNGHEGTGMANSYHQARCIALAKKGLYAINVEWIGQTQLATPGLQHYRMNQLDLVGTPGLAVFYESLRRTVDIALTLPQVNKARVAVTGLSGGGWQTIFLSALDTRVALATPVAGYSSYVTRTQWPDKDLGDSEQTPSDLASIADYTHLTAMMAPRALLLTYNARDSCCFRADYALGNLLQQARPAFDLLGAGNRLAWHVNHDEGHNYERDNREAFYRFIHAELLGGRADFDPNEGDLSGEIRTLEALTIPVPAGNATFTSLARDILDALPARPAPRRDRLQYLVKAPRYDVRAVEAGSEGTTSFLKLHMGPWTVPATVLASSTSTPTGTTLVLADAGRAKAAAQVTRVSAEGRRVVALDPWYIGESALGQRDFLFGLLVAALGERPLGLQVAQVTAAARWARATHGAPVHVSASGPRTSLVALVAAALEPEAIAGVETEGAWSSLREVLDRDITAQQMPEMFTFGLLAEFDVPQIEQLVAPRAVVRR